MGGPLSGIPGVGKPLDLAGAAAGLVDKEKKFSTAVTTAGMFAGLIQVKIEIDPAVASDDPKKTSGTLKLIQQSLGMDVTGKPTADLLEKLGVKSLSDINTDHVKAAVEKLKADNKLGSDMYKPGSDTSAAHHLAAAISEMKPNKFLSQGFEPWKQAIITSLPPAPAVGAQPAPAAPSVPGTSASPAPQPAQPSQPAGPAVITGNAVNEAVHGLVGTLAKLENPALRTIPGNVSPVIQFLERALEIKGDDGKPMLTGQTSPKLLEALGISDIKELDGKKLSAVVEKLQGEGKFSNDRDPALAQALVAAVKDIRVEGLTASLIRLELNRAQAKLEDAVKTGIGRKVSMDGSDDPIVVAGGYQSAADDYVPVPSVPVAQTVVADAGGAAGLAAAVPVSKPNTAPVKLG